MKPFLKRWLSRLALMITPVLLIYLPFEFLFFKTYLPHLPMRYHQRLMEPYQMLTQISKKGTMPRDYTLILGDSFASGWGDWLRSVDIGRNEPYGPHDLIYQATGIDTVQGGFAGGSATESFVRKPVNRYRFLRKTLLYKPEDPKRILLFFYEGNDLVDDLSRLEKAYKDKIDRSRIYDETYFREFLDTEVMKSDALYYDVRRFRWHYNLVSFHLAREIARNLLYNPQAKETPPPASKEGTNCFGSREGQVCIGRGDVLCPPVYLDEEQMRLSLYILGESLDYLKEFFPRSEFAMIYVPAPITSYPIASEEVSIQKQNQEDTFVAKTAAVFENSDEVFRRVGDVAAARGMRLIDTRDALRKAAFEEGSRFLHGPKDFYHFNRRGYEVFTKALLEGLGWTKAR